MSIHNTKLPEDKPLFATQQEYDDWRNGFVDGLERANCTIAQPTPEYGFVISRRDYPRHLARFNQYGPVWTSNWEGGLVVRAEELAHLISKLTLKFNGLKATLKEWPKGCQHRNIVYCEGERDWCPECGKSV